VYFLSCHRHQFSSCQTDLFSRQELTLLLRVVFDRMLVSVGKDLKEPLLIALAEREDANRSGKMVVSYSNCAIFRRKVILVFLGLFTCQVATHHC